VSTRYKKYRRRERIISNSQVRFPEVRTLDEQGNMIGIMSSREAYLRARDEDKDLVLITGQAQPPVVKIIELSKFKYQQQQKAAKARKKNRAQNLKEVRFSMFMGEGDLQSRKNKVLKFLKDGDKVRLSLQFKGRQITKKEFAFDLFAKVIEEVEEKELGKIEIQPKIVGRKLIAQLTPT
jgi:translation initiation factor IF-3